MPEKQCNEKTQGVCLCGSVFLMAFGAALLWARFTLLPKAEDLIRTGANEKINGTFSFAYMDMSLTGELILTDVAVKDETGREVLETEEARISVSPVRAFRHGRMMPILRRPSTPLTWKGLWFMCGRTGGRRLGM